MTNSRLSSSRNQCHTRTEWQIIVKRLSERKLSIEQFCKQESILPVTLRKWQRRFNSVSSTDSFIELTPAKVRQPVSADPLLPTGHWDIELDLGHGMALRIRRS